MLDFKIESRLIGPGEPVYYLAEIGLNHNGDLDLAARMIRAASRTGAEGVKFQTYKSETLADPECDPELYRIFKQSELSEEDHVFLRDRCHEAGLAFVSTPFDEESVELLFSCGVSAFKIASGDLTNHPLLRSVAKFGLPVILSTGMGYMDEIIESINLLQENGSGTVLPLHCVWGYPPDECDMNMRSIPSMRKALQRQVGYSDHYVGELAALTATILGAVFIEKHFTTDKNLPGPDHRLSADEGELRTIIEKTRSLEAMLGDGIKQPGLCEQIGRSVGRPGIYAAKKIPAGTRIARSDLKIARPEGNLSSSKIDLVIGSYATEMITAGDSISLSLLTKKPCVASKQVKSGKNVKV